MSARRPILIPEVVQTSQMDCGPAALAALMSGLGIPCNYGRLREACHTDLDGTSIDTLEEVACALGLDAEQVVIPRDHLFLKSANALPAIVVSALPNQATHFVVAWRRVGGLVQLMDPAVGRRWSSVHRFERDVYEHTMEVEASSWEEWARSDEAQAGYRERMQTLGLGNLRVEALLKTASDTPGHQGLACLDAAMRMVKSFVDAGGLRPGSEAHALLCNLIDKSRAAEAFATIIPDRYWSVVPSGDESSVIVRGAVLVRARPAEDVVDQGSESELSGDMLAAVREPSPRPMRALVEMVGQDGLFQPVQILAMVSIVALGLLLEALVFRGLIGLSDRLTTIDLRVGAMAAATLLVLSLLLLEASLLSMVLATGRFLEIRFRAAFLRKLPRLGDRYLESRPTSDMAHRAHNIHSVRRMPEDLAIAVRGGLELVMLALAIAWVAPASGVLAFLAAFVTIAIPWLFYPALRNLDFKSASHGGSLSCFYFDALRGLAPIRAHGAERSIFRAHTNLLVHWFGAARSLLLLVVVADTLQFLLGFGLAALIITQQAGSAAGSGGLLLVVYWALSIPIRGQAVAQAIRHLPKQRNMLLRLLEPLGAPEPLAEEHAERSSRKEEALASPSPAGVGLHFENTSLVSSGHLILQDLDLEIEAGCHVAIVGRSGSGKSSFLGLLLGWHKAAAGRVLVDGEPLDGERLARLRRQTAWVDPAVHLWDSSVIENLVYGASPEEIVGLPSAIKSAELQGVLMALSDGLQSQLGEGGGRLSGGQGQRVRLSRAMLRPSARLVLLDEAFRGLEKPLRRELLARTRSLWQHATMLCVTHDVDMSVDFDRVLVFEGGRLVEDGAPSVLAAADNSRYGQLLRAHELAKRDVWGAESWRKIIVARRNLAPNTQAVPKGKSA